jgi:hypothetical protein
MSTLLGVIGGLFATLALVAFILLACPPKDGDPWD